MYKAAILRTKVFEGDFEVIADLESISPILTDSSSGLIFSDISGLNKITLELSPNGELTMNDSLNGVWKSDIGITGLSLPITVKMTRAGNTARYYYKKDGEFVQLGSRTGVYSGPGSIRFDTESWTPSFPAVDSSFDNFSLTCMLPAVSNARSTCLDNGTKVQFDWTAVPGARDYQVMFDDPSNNAATCLNGWVCPNTEDKQNLAIVGTTFTMNITPNKNYKWWMWTESGYTGNSTVHYDLNCSNSSNNSSSNNNSTPSCNDSKPSSAPDLFQIDSTSTSAKLFFTSVSNKSDYYISYSTKSNAEEHGVQVTLGGGGGVQNFTVNLLKPNTTYYFKVRGQNGCMPGDWSSIVKMETKGDSSFYANSPTRITLPVTGNSLPTYSVIILGIFLIIGSFFFLV